MGQNSGNTRLAGGRSPSGPPLADALATDPIGRSGSEFAILGALPVPLLVRARGGRVAYINPVACSVLRLTEQEAAGDVRVTRIQRNPDHEPSLYLLAFGGAIQRRIQARSAAVDDPGGERLDLLVVEPPHERDGGQAERILKIVARRTESLGQAVDQMRHEGSRDGRSILRVQTRLRELRDTISRLRSAESDDEQRMAWHEPRALLADLVRRIQRHHGPAASWRLGLEHELERPGPNSRMLWIDPVAVAQIVLSGIDLFRPGSEGGVILLRSREVGFRLRLVIDGSDLPDQRGAADLKGRNALIRQLSPILLAQGATFEVHRGAGARNQVILTLPTHPARDA